jgi:hypothetical protein
VYRPLDQVEEVEVVGESDGPEQRRARIEQLREIVVAFAKQDRLDQHNRAGAATTLESLSQVSAFGRRVGALRRKRRG